MTVSDRPEMVRLFSDVVFWGERIIDHLHGVTEDEFASDRLRCDAVRWCIACIGEAAGKIVQRWPDLGPLHAELELSNAYAMRNRISHGYFSIDFGIVWRAATESVPALVIAARREIDAV